jgi:hypothetical protein
LFLRQIRISHLTIDDFESQSSGMKCNNANECKQAALTARAKERRDRETGSVPKERRSVCDAALRRMADVPAAGEKSSQTHKKKK